MHEITAEPKYLSSEERGRTRTLYQAAFPEDTERFVDFYYQYKTRDNQILVLEQDGQIVSMLHRNSYTMIMNGYEFPADYIVAVATEKAFRHQGCMRKLLEKALNDVADQGMPFAFLMPASESIYAPFDFVWICPYMELPMRVERMSTEAQNRYLAGRYQMFCKRDTRYMENLQAERIAEEGETMPDHIPPFMARITDVMSMLRLIGSREKKVLYLKIKDPIVEKNNGYFCWTTAPEESTAERLEKVPEHIDLELTIGELTSFLFEGMKICLSESV